MGLYLLITRPEKYLVVLFVGLHMEHRYSFSPNSVGLLEVYRRPNLAIISTDYIYKKSEVGEVMNTFCADGDKHVIDCMMQADVGD